MAAVKDSLLKDGAKMLAVAAGKRVLSSATDKIGSATERLTDYTGNGGGPGLLSALTGKGGGDGGGGGGGQGGSGKNKSLKQTVIIESLDIGVPVRLAYDLWTQFTDFPKFMKKVESVEQQEDEKLSWKAQVFWSHRNWESTITEQVPDRRIVWRSKGAKGYVDGAVTFHEIAPELTRIQLVLEYHPQGFFERTANLWRAQGRRARLEFKHFQRYAMTEAILNPDDITGWRGEIHDGEVTKDDETARSEEEQAEKDQAPTDQPEKGRGGVEEGRSTEDGHRRRRPDEKELSRRSSDEDGQSEENGRRGRRPARRSDDARRPARAERG
jgi:hypothetical protein